MIPAAFDYVRPATLGEALALLADGPGNRVISGGQSLLPLLKLRLAEADRLVDIGGLPELQGIREAPDGGLIIGAATTYREILDSLLVAERCPLLIDVVSDIGDVQVRNRGTIGGSLAHADPSSDMPAAVLAVEATLALRSARAQRAGAALGFFRGPFSTVLEPDEIVIEVRIPPWPANAGWAYEQLVQPASGYPLVGVAAIVARAGPRISQATLALTGVGEAPYRASGTEAALLGADGSAGAIAAAAALATDGQQVRSDLHADADYRSAMAVVLTRRAIEAALRRAA
jgi:carbon-monoxide dehydrogenase medium subunit